MIKTKRDTMGTTLKSDVGINLLVSKNINTITIPTTTATSKSGEPTAANVATALMLPQIIPFPAPWRNDGR